MGDFNTVTSLEERQGSSSHIRRQYMQEFTAFITGMSLAYVPLCGKHFTRFFLDGYSRSRLNQFLVSEGVDFSLVD